MHLYMITRGIKKQVDDFIVQLQGKYLPFQWRQSTDGKSLDHTQPLVQGQTQLQVRPIQLWEIVFPEEHKDLILNSVLAGKQGTEQTQHKKHNKFIWAIRKALGCEPIGDYKKDSSFVCGGDCVERIGIGLKKDYWIGADGKHYPNKIEGSFEGL